MSRDLVAVKDLKHHHNLDMLRFPTLQTRSLYVEYERRSSHLKFTYIQDHLKFTYIQDHLKFTYIQDHFVLTNQNP